MRQKRAQQGCEPVPIKAEDTTIAPQPATKGLQDTTELTTMKFEFNPKDGIDNPALSLAEDSELEGAAQVRFCFLKKEDGESFGFWLRQEVGDSGHIVRQVTPGGLAHRRGLCSGDRILEVNGVSVEGMEHFRVVWKIKSSGKQVSLTVLAGTAYDLAKALSQDLAQLLPCHNRPQLCHVVKDQSGFGFSVSAPEGVKGTFRLSVPRDGPAHQAGVLDGSWLLELNGVSVKNWTPAQLQKKLKHSSNPMGLLVIDVESEEFYRQRGVKVTATMADASWVPFKVRKLPMVRGPDGYGFLLKEEKRCTGEGGQFLREIESGLPAEKAGMRDGDRLLAVNGESTEELDHQKVVLRIRADSSRVTLLVIDAEGSKFYDLVGLSPLLFYDDPDPPSGLRATPASPSPSVLQGNSSPSFSPCSCHLRRSLHENGLQHQSGDGSFAFMEEGQDGLSQAF
ncbi:Na(+)/H(+) exchange regulatory cofactor NHE-RF4 isoform X2 [Rhineura floridana]|uniref:Na(+)/H(+) exchange regulatory cofactor NHE-RF4 isoform X2 n=1 Tax=Rhineura floridana TaxID=261503 RepID=UPI002AC811C3|nr:Na(+)/H(+) exchange regulatory cofactor NHE-RF4 isoform X2 [Rhineura floridana]